MTRWWEPRRDGEMTTVFLGRVLDELGLATLARRAREGHFDDYFCPPGIDDGMNIHRLIAELQRCWRQQREKRERIDVLIDAAKRGEFDGTKEESDRWAASKEGQAVFRSLLEGR